MSSSMEASVIQCLSISGVEEQFYAFTVSKSNYTILKALGSSGLRVLANIYV